MRCLCRSTQSCLLPDDIPACERAGIFSSPKICLPEYFLLASDKIICYIVVHGKNSDSPWTSDYLRWPAPYPILNPNPLATGPKIHLQRVMPPVALEPAQWKPKRHGLQRTPVATGTDGAYSAPPKVKLCL